MQAIISMLQSLVRRSATSVVIGIVVVTIALGAATQLSVQQQGFQNFLPDNEVSATQATIDEQFTAGGAARIQISVFAPDGGDVLSADGVATALALRAQIEADPTIFAALVGDSGSGGASDAASGQDAGGGVITWADPVLQAATEQGVDPATLTDEQVDQLYGQALANIPEQQRGLLAATLGGDRTETSATAGVVVLTVQPDAVSDAGDTPVQQAVVALRQDIDGFEVRPFDIASLTGEISDVITDQLTQLLALAVILIIVILIAIYRRPMDVVASLLGLGFTIVWMQGIAALLGPDGLGWTGGISELTLAIPILLVGLGVDYGIHLTMRYREERADGLAPTEAATGAIGAVGVALLLATITTAVGFLTNVTNPLPPLQDFGVFAAVGVISAFVIMTGFVPAVRVLVDRWRQARGRLTGERHQSSEPGVLGRIAGGLAPVAVGKPWAVLGVAGLLVVVGGVGATGLSTEFSQTEFFPQDSPALEQIERTQEAFAGDITETTEVFVEGDVATPAVLNAMLAFQETLADNPDVRNQVPVDSPLERLEAVRASIEQSMGSDEQAPLPDGVDPMTVQQFTQALLSSNVGTGQPVADDLDVAALYDGLLALDPSSGAVLSGDGDSGFDAALVSVPTAAGEDVDQLQASLQRDAAVFDDAGVTFQLASDNLLVDVVLSELQSSQIRGLVITLLASMVILALAFWARERKPMLGVLSIVAVAAVVAWVFGLMAAIGIPFNVMTAMVSSLAIGIGVPYGIHVVNRFLEDRVTHDDVLTAMTSTLRNTGGALIGSAGTTIAGFGVLVVSTIPPMRQFGLVLAMTIGLALVSSIVVLPAMLAVWSRRHPPHTAPDRAAQPTPLAAGSGAAPRHSATE